MTASRAEKLYFIIAKQWAEAEKKNRENVRAITLEQIDRYISECEGIRMPNGVWRVKPNHGALAKYLDMKNRIYGLYEPIKIDVNISVNATLQSITAALTPEQIDEQLQFVRDMQRKAELFEQMQVSPQLPPKKDE